MEINHPRASLAMLLILAAVVLSIVLINVQSPTGSAIYENAAKLNECSSLNESGYYLLQDDIYSRDDCLIVNSDDIIIDCSGHKILGAGEGYGITIINKNNIVIKNCEIHDFLAKIYSEDSDVKLINSNIEEIPTVTTEVAGQGGVFGRAVDFAQTGTGITFIIIALVAGVAIAAFVLKAPEPSKSYDELDRFLIVAIRKGHKPEHIKKALVDKGWEKDFVDRYYSDFVRKVKK